MSVVVVQKSSQLVATYVMLWKGFRDFKWFKILVATRPDLSTLPDTRYFNSFAMD